MKAFRKQHNIFFKWRGNTLNVFISFLCYLHKRAIKVFISNLCLVCLKSVYVFSVIKSDSVMTNSLFLSSLSLDRFSLPPFFPFLFLFSTFSLFLGPPTIKGTIHCPCLSACPLNLYENTQTERESLSSWLLSHLKENTVLVERFVIHYLLSNHSTQLRSPLLLSFYFILLSNVRL